METVRYTLAVVSTLKGLPCRFTGCEWLHALTINFHVLYRVVNHFKALV